LQRTGDRQASALLGIAASTHPKEYTILHTSHAMLAARGETGLTPQNARNRKAAFIGPARMSAAMEAVMARKADAVATPRVRSNGVGSIIPAHNPDAHTKSL